MEHATLLVCRDAAERAAYSHWLRADGKPVVEVATAGEAIAHHRSAVFPLTIAELPSVDSLKLIRAVRDAEALAEFLMLFHPDSMSAGLDAIRAGAADLLLKPVGRENFVESVRRVSALIDERQANLSLVSNLREQYDFSEIVACSPAILRVLALAGRVASGDTTVLITGESGTGKELIASAVHRNSARARRPLVCINCAAIPETLIESELFGYRKGAFTGADADKPGLLETADGGTLFLDEVAELPLPTQAKLLRFVQQGSYYPLGDVCPGTADVRLISATNASLEERVEAGTFRRDLYYRLSVFPIHVPPLRERPEDIVPLAEHLLGEMEKRIGKPAPGLSREVLSYLTARSWRGNVRELQSALERAAVMSDGSLLTSADFYRLDQDRDRGVSRRAACSPRLDDGVDLNDLNRRLIAEALERTSYNVSAAARALGLSRPALRSRMKKYRLGRQVA